MKILSALATAYAGLAFASEAAIEAQQQAEAIATISPVILDQLKNDPNLLPAWSKSGAMIMLRSF
jgi:hypothetical protein